MLLPGSTTPTNSHTLWNMKGTDVLDTEILYWTKRCIGTPMAFEHSECGLYKILEYMGMHEILPPGAGQNRAKLRKDIGVFLEYTRAMARDMNEDWVEKKKQEKNDRYSSHLGFINHLSNWEKSGWKASQTNFTTWVRGSLHTNQFLTTLESLRVKNKNTREAIRNRTVQKILSMSDMILKFFSIALNSETEWTLQNLPTEIVNKNMERSNLHLQPPRMWPDHIV